MRTRRWFGVWVVRAAAFVLFLGGVAGPATAAPLYTITNNSTGDQLGNPPFTLGFQFTELTDQSVTALGFYDSGLDGLSESHQLGLWDSSGNLLASATVAAGTTDPLVNQFRYAPVSPVTLLAGQTYQLGALYPTGDDPVNFPGDATGFAMNPVALFDQATFAFGGTLANPTSGYSTDPGFFGPNLILVDLPPPAPVIPEPSSLALLALGTAALATGRLWRKRPCAV